MIKGTAANKSEAKVVVCEFWSHGHALRALTASNIKVIGVLIPMLCAVLAYLFFSVWLDLIDALVISVVVYVCSVATLICAFLISLGNVIVYSFHQDGFFVSRSPCSKFTSKSLLPDRRRCDVFSSNEVISVKLKSKASWKSCNQSRVRYVQLCYTLSGYRRLKHYFNLYSFGAEVGPEKLFEIEQALARIEQTLGRDKIDIDQYGTWEGVMKSIGGKR